MIDRYDVIIIGAGAAGMMCAIEAGTRGKKVLILEKTTRAGKKILMSGGGRCNFTNLNTTSAQFISNNPHFCKSALSAYTPYDFIALVEKYHIKYYEKTLGQLFCEGKSNEIVDMLLKECARYAVQIHYSQTIHHISKEEHFKINTDTSKYQCTSLVIATGGLSIPTLGSTPFGYQIANQFGLNVYPTRAGLVPLTLHPEEKDIYAALSGISINCRVHCNNIDFEESLLFTHRGLSGPAILQISSYWDVKDDIKIKICPNMNWHEELTKAKKGQGNTQLKTYLNTHLPKKFIVSIFKQEILDKPLKQLEHKDFESIHQQLTELAIKPAGTEGYRTAEVTLGGVDCNELSSKTMEAKKIPGLYFVGEVMDVTGWLGGYNFQWAWASGYAAGRHV